MELIYQEVDDLPPFSINWAWQGKQFKTKEYSEWRESLLWILPKHEMLDGYVELRLRFFFDKKSFLRVDVDNFAKTLIDAIVEKGYIKDDRYILRLVLEKYTVESGKRFDFSIRKINLNEFDLAKIY